MNDVCSISDSTIQRQAETQDALKKKPLRVGDVVKVAIGEGKTTEYVWFTVIAIKGDQFCGELENIPVFPQKILWKDLEWLPINKIIDRVDKDGQKKGR